MFGRKQPEIVILPGQTRELHPVNIRVSQQPNDAADSARLYGELLEKARKEVQNQIAHEIPSAMPTPGGGQMFVRGMTMRQYYAGQALAGMAVSIDEPETCATKAFAIADAMIKAEGTPS